MWEAMRPPISTQMDKAEGPQAPRVSMTIGVKIKSPEATRSAYLIDLRASALSATDPAPCEEAVKCERARVLGQVKSRTK